jgi:adenine-specific DNA-methyltransferase
MTITLTRPASEKQIPLWELEPDNTTGVFPTTRYQGSKNKIIDWIEYCTKDLDFETVLDAFGGTGSVSYLFKSQGKQVFYNDYLQFNTIIGQALIENNNVFLEDEDLDFLFAKHSNIEYPTFIFDNFHDIYFTDEENQWLDLIVTNIHHLGNKYKKSLAFFALFQACIIKRPYNLFHRKNLYVRTANVTRSFGNKKTWDTPFEKHFLKFVEQGKMAVFDNGKQNLSFNGDIFDWNFSTPDLVYIDTPYISKKGVGVNYFDFYHFLEGLTKYEKWGTMIDQETKHKKIKNGKNEWCKKEEINKAFENLFTKFKDSKLVISYRDDGIPTTEELIEILEKLGKKVEIKKMDYKYVLSNANSKEVLILAL